MDGDDPRDRWDRSERRGTRKSQEARQRSKNKIMLSTEPRTSAQPWLWHGNPDPQRVKKKTRTAGAGQRRGSLVTCLYLVPGWVMLGTSWVCGFCSSHAGTWHLNFEMKPNKWPSLENCFDKEMLRGRRRWCWQSSGAWKMMVIL